jgi:hypothetical protein
MADAKISKNEAVRLAIVELGREAIAKDMALDRGTFELADKHKLSAGRISQLRRELHADWRRFNRAVC